MNGNKKIIVRPALPKSTDESAIEACNINATIHETYFTEVLLARINDKIVKEGWGIIFTQVDPLSKNFLVDIFVDDEQHYLDIKNICNTVINLYNTNGDYYLHFDSHKSAYLFLL